MHVYCRTRSWYLILRIFGRVDRTDCAEEAPAEPQTDVDALVTFRDIDVRRRNSNYRTTTEILDILSLFKVHFLKPGVAHNIALHATHDIALHANYRNI